MTYNCFITLSITGICRRKRKLKSSNILQLHPSCLCIDLAIGSIFLTCSELIITNPALNFFLDLFRYQVRTWTCLTILLQTDVEALCFLVLISLFLSIFCKFFKGFDSKWLTSDHSVAQSRSINICTCGVEHL